jgi:hypothetical protein
MLSFTLVLEFYDVEVAISGAHQLRLRPAAHAPHVLDRLGGHEVSIVQAERNSAGACSCSGPGVIRSEIYGQQMPCP